MVNSTLKKDEHILVNRTAGILSSETCMSLKRMRNQNKDMNKLLQLQEAMITTCTQ